MLNGRLFTIPFEDPCCPIPPLQSVKALVEHFATTEHINNVDKLLREAAMDQDGELTEDLVAALRATCIVRLTTPTTRDRIKAMAKATAPPPMSPARQEPISPALASPGAGAGRQGSMDLQNAYNYGIPSQGVEAGSQLRPGTGPRPATAKTTTKPLRGSPSPSHAQQLATTLSLREAKEGVQMLLDSVNALSSSSSDENEQVYVLTLAKLVHHGLKFEEIPLGAVCDICRRFGDPADLSNEHTLRKHLSGRNHKKRLREELARLDRALAAEESLSTSSSSSSSGPSGNNYRGDLKGPPPLEKKDDRKPTVAFHTYNALNPPVRQDNKKTFFPCANLNCKAKCVAEARDTKTKCGKCGLMQVVSGR